jgi:hypothetical protein
MSHRRLFCFALMLGVSVATTATLRAQADLISPKLREKVVADAVRVAETRNTSVPLPSPLPNPFIPKERDLPKEQPAFVPSAPSAAEPTLAILAARIPSTGTVSIGGEPLLLLGQKRLKVGDTITISFEGQTYELSIAAVTSTSFTVKRGENIYTRPVRISASSTNTPTNRP